MKTDFIPAATLLFLRDDPTFQVLMMERHKDVGFAGGALVFPGGRVEASDGDPEWSSHCCGKSDADRIAAIREGFEEVGLLLARRRGESELVGDDIVQALNSARAQVEADDTLFMQMIAGEGLELACDKLFDFAHWAPPENVTHRRYDTRFFAAAAPRGQIAREDGHEATDALWLSPTQCLDAVRRGERQMIFPTTRNVELLGVSDTTAAVRAFARVRKIERITPEIVERDGVAYLIIPDGFGYPVTEFALKDSNRS